MNQLSAAPDSDLKMIFWQNESSKQNTSMMPMQLSLQEHYVVIFMRPLSLLIIKSPWVVYQL